MLTGEPGWAARVGPPSPRRTGTGRRPLPPRSPRQGSIRPSTLGASPARWPAGHRYFRVRVPGQARAAQRPPGTASGWASKAGATRRHPRAPAPERAGGAGTRRAAAPGRLPATLTWLKHRYQQVAPAVFTARLLRHGPRCSAGNPRARGGPAGPAADRGGHQGAGRIRSRPPGRACHRRSEPSPGRDLRLHLPGRGPGGAAIGAGTRSPGAGPGGSPSWSQGRRPRSRTGPGPRPPAYAAPARPLWLISTRARPGRPAGRRDRALDRGRAHPGRPGRDRRARRMGRPGALPGHPGPLPAAQHRLVGGAGS